VTHRIEPAPTGRAKCRACKKAIGKAELRLGVSVPNAFGAGDALQWFHLICGAERRCAEFVEALDSPPDEDAPKVEVPNEAELRARAAIGQAHPRWTRVAWAERAATGRAKCRHCREAIEAGSIRIALEFVEEGMINAAGFLHPSCARAYLGTVEYLADRLRRVSALEGEQLDVLEAALEAGLPATEGASASDDSAADGESGAEPDSTADED